MLDAPSNLGLRPGRGGTISGVDRLAATVRAAGLMQRLQDVVAGSVEDAGVVSAPAYDLTGWRPGAPFEPGGLTPDGLVALLQPLLADPRVRGIDVCIYDPALDTPDAPGAELLADVLGRAFSHGSPQ